MSEIERNLEFVGRGKPLERQNIVATAQRRVVTGTEGRRLLAEQNELPVQVQDRALVLLHVADIPRAGSFHRQPRLAGCEAAVVASVPSHGHTLGIAIEIISWNKLFEWILHCSLRNYASLRSELISGKEERGAF